MPVGRLVYRSGTSGSGVKAIVGTGMRNSSGSAGLLEIGEQLAAARHQHDRVHVWFTPSAVGQADVARLLQRASAAGSGEATT